MAKSSNKESHAHLSPSLPTSPQNETTLSPTKPKRWLLLYPGPTENDRSAPTLGVTTQALRGAF
jgi:hypothetical protein